MQALSIAHSVRSPFHATRDGGTTRSLQIERAALGSTRHTEMSHELIPAQPSSSPPTTLVLATHNRGKVAELRALVEGLLASGHDSHGPRPRLEIIDATELSTREPVEDQATYDGNALIKARALGFAHDRMVLADDTGIEIEILDGAPGVDTKAMYQALGSWHAVHVELDRRMRSAGASSAFGRAARLVCVLAVVDSTGDEYLARGECEGMIRVPLAVGDHGGGARPGHAEYGLTDIFSPTHGWRDPKGPMPHRVAAFDRLAPTLRRLLGLSSE